MTAAVAPSEEAVLQRALAGTEHLSAADVKILQRTVGNRAMSRFLHPAASIKPDPSAKLSLVQRAGGKNGGIVSPTGPAGSMILFHGCLLHASTSNLSPWNRVSVYLSLCAVTNHIRRFKRPEYIAHRDFTPITTLPDDCLLHLGKAA